MTLSLPERMERLEDEVQALESMLDARTRKLWAEIQKLQEKLAELSREGEGNG